MRTSVNTLRSNRKLETCTEFASCSGSAPPFHKLMLGRERWIEKERERWREHDTSRQKDRLGDGDEKREI